MSAGNRDAAPTDADLVAYLDGELSPADSVRIGQRLAADERLAARVQHLMQGARPFREALAPLLTEAPIERLEATLDAALAQPAPSSLRWTVSIRSRAAMAAAVAALLAAGAGIDRLALMPLGRTLVEAVVPTEGSDDWRRAVAQYLSLYTSETVARAGDGSTASAALAGLGTRIGLDLTPARIDLPGLALRRADLYDYDGKPLAFLVYLDPAGPVALCIIEGHGGSDAQRVERRRGMNVVYWSQGAHSFMLIGRAGSDRLQGLATTVADRF